MRILWPIYNLQKEYSQYPGVMGMSSLLAENGFEVEIAPADYHHMKERLAQNGRTIVAYSTLSSFAQRSLELNRQIKQEFPEVFSVFGGPHPTFFPDMIEEEGVDGICIGEGEYPLLELATNLAAENPITSIRNWWIKDHGKVYRNPPRPLIENLDELPLPDHELFRRSIPGQISQAIIITSRGCPYIYRQIYEGKGTVVRRRSVDNVLKELMGIKEKGYTFIRFMDDLFILSHEWVEEFSKKYQSQIGLPFSCLVRANYVSGDITKMLHEAGCYRMTMGVEAGNDYVRNKILKRNMSKEQILNAARVIKDAGIRLTTANILAIPGGSLDADLETLHLNIQCRPNYASVALMEAYPRTEIYEYAKKEGLLDEKHLDVVGSSIGFGLSSAIKFRDKVEKRRMENLHKLFPLAVRFPWCLPLVRKLIRLPSNRIFDFIYRCSVSYGIHMEALPPRIGLTILLRKIDVNKLFRYRLK
jgi:radical SAM superfamily enzyme YgiQ (UPF0313 family)